MLFWRWRQWLNRNPTVIQSRDRRSRFPARGVPRQLLHLERLEERTLLSSAVAVPPSHSFVPSQAAPASSAPAAGSVSGPFTVGTSFIGTQESESGYVPPDTLGGVSDTQVLVTSNGIFRVYDKAGNLGGLNESSDTFFASELAKAATGSFSSDPHARYDRLTGRWFITMISATTSATETGNRIMIAVSNSATITGQSSFTFFSFVGDTSNFSDYDTLGVDANALYIGVNLFQGNNSTGSKVFVVNKADLLTGTLQETSFTTDSNGAAIPFTPQGVDNTDPAATEGFFIGVDESTPGRLVIVPVANPGSATPTLPGDVNLTVPNTAQPIPQPAKRSTTRSGTVTLDSIDDRLFEAQIETNLLTGVSSLWTAQNIQVDATGAASNTGGRNGSRWYQIGNLTTTPTLTQSGTLFDPATTNPSGFWMPTVAMNGQGDMALGSSIASAVTFPQDAVAARFAGDPLGTLRAFTIAQSSTSPYNQSNGGQPERWGDYSQTVVDPSDDMTIWTFQEYATSTSNWVVRAIQLKAPPPATPSSTNQSVAQGAANVNITVTGTSSGGSGFFDPGSSFPNHISATVGGSGVTVNSVTFTSPTQIVLNVTVAANATAGARTITVTNPDGQAATSASGILTVTAGGQQLNLSSSTYNIAEPNATSATETVTVTRTGGSAGQVTVQYATSDGSARPAPTTPAPAAPSPSAPAKPVPPSRC